MYVYSYKYMYILGLCRVDDVVETSLKQFVVSSVKKKKERKVKLTGFLHLVAFHCVERSKLALPTNTPTDTHACTYTPRIHNAYTQTHSNKHMQNAYIAK